MMPDWMLYLLSSLTVLLVVFGWLGAHARSAGRWVLSSDSKEHECHQPSLWLRPWQGSGANWRCECGTLWQVKRTYAGTESWRQWVLHPSEVSARRDVQHKLAERIFEPDLLSVDVPQELRERRLMVLKKAASGELNSWQAKVQLDELEVRFGA